MPFEPREPEWELARKHFGNPDPQEDASVWQAPDVAIRGWIPFRSEAEQLQPGWLREMWPTELAVRELFRSGNDEPRSTFRGPGDFLDSLGLKDFRCALALFEPKLYYAADGTPRLFTCWRAHRVGFTPMRAGNFPKYSPGPDDRATLNRPDVSLQGSEVVFHTHLKFRLSRFADAIGTIMTLHSAPYAVVSVRLAMDTKGGVKVTYDSSYLPSQHLYLDWKVDQHYDMLDVAKDDFWGFIKAGRLKEAPSTCATQMQWMPLAAPPLEG